MSGESNLRSLMSPDVGRPIAGSMPTSGREFYNDPNGRTPDGPQLAVATWIAAVRLPTPLRSFSSVCPPPETGHSKVLRISAGTRPSPV